MPRAISPSTPTSTGTLRQPSTVQPWAPRQSSSTLTVCWSSAGGKNTMPTPSNSPSARTNPVDCSRYATGMPVMTPTPSLDRPSAATAPRCASRARAVNAYSRMGWFASARVEATKPTPHESCSKRSSSSDSGERSMLRGEGKNPSTVEAAASSVAKIGWSIVHYTTETWEERDCFADDFMEALDMQLSHIYTYSIAFLCKYVAPAACCFFFAEDL